MPPWAQLLLWIDLVSISVGLPLFLLGRNELDHQKMAWGMVIASAPMLVTCLVLIAVVLPL